MAHVAARGVVAVLGVGVNNKLASIGPPPLAEDLAARGGCGPPSRRCGSCQGTAWLGQEVLGKVLVVVL